MINGIFSIESISSEPSKLTIVLKCVFYDMATATIIITNAILNDSIRRKATKTERLNENIDNENIREETKRKLFFFTNPLLNVILHETIL